MTENLNHTNYAPRKYYVNNSSKLNKYGVCCYSYKAFKFQISHFACCMYLKTRYEISRPSHSRGILKSTGNVSTPPYFMSIQYSSKYSDRKNAGPSNLKNFLFLRIIRKGELYIFVQLQVNIPKIKK